MWQLAYGMRWGSPPLAKSWAGAPQEEASSLFPEEAAQKAFVAFSPFLPSSNIDWDFCGAAGADRASIFYLCFDSSMGELFIVKYISSIFNRWIANILFTKLEV